MEIEKGVLSFLWFISYLTHTYSFRLSGLVNKEEIELKETLFGEKKSNGINGHFESNDIDRVKNGADDKKQSS